jgi:hypothetical protein
MEKIKVVVRYGDGKLIKGFTQDFFPNKEHFHLVPADSPSNGAIEVSTKELKAIFVVRDFSGDPLYNERKKYIEGEKPSGKKVEVTFTDGEVLVGSTLGYDPKRQGFFIFPADPQSNSIRVYVVCSQKKSAIYHRLEGLFQEHPYPDDDEG